MKTRITDLANKHIHCLINIGDIIIVIKFQAYNAYKLIVCHLLKELIIIKKLTIAIIELPNVLLHASHHKHQMKILDEFLKDPHATCDMI